MPSILLHICCAPCATAIIEKLQKEGFDVTGFFYNPNIQPLAEHEKRLDSLRKYLKTKQVDLIHEKTAEDYAQEYKQAIQGCQSPAERCTACYDLRLKETARQAQQMDMDVYTSTLLASPHQDIEMIRKLGEKYAREFDVDFFYPDSGNKKFKGFRPLFTRGRKLAKAAKLYEQTYCGCPDSQKEAFAKGEEK